jgi:hypothetical protein
LSLILSPIPFSFLFPRFVPVLISSSSPTRKPVCTSVVIHPSSPSYSRYIYLHTSIHIYIYVMLSFLLVSS